MQSPRDEFIIATRDDATWRAAGSIANAATGCDVRSVTAAPPPPAARSRQFACKAPNCGRAFAKKWNLQAHERLHTGHKPFACRLGCGERHMWMSSLKSHERRKCKLLPESMRLRRKTRVRKSALSDSSTSPSQPADVATIPTPYPDDHAISVVTRGSDGGGLGSLSDVTRPTAAPAVGRELNRASGLCVNVMGTNATAEQIIFELEHILSSK